MTAPEQAPATALDGRDDALALGLRVLPLHTWRDGRCTCDEAAVCKNGGKHPRWNGWQREASTNAATVERWRRRYPGTNWGAATGSVSDLYVFDLDLDADGHPVGEDTWRREVGDLPDTRIVRTGSGGLQIYSRYPSRPAPDGASWGNTAKKLGPGIDTRGANGQVVLPGSVSYKGTYTVWRDRPIASPDDDPLLARAFELLTTADERKAEKRATEHRRAEESQVRGMLQPAGGAGLHPWLAHGLERMAAEFETVTAPGNGRAATLFGLAARGAEMVNVSDGRLTEADVADRLRVAAHRNGFTAEHPEVSDGETYTDRQIRRGLDEGRGGTPVGWPPRESAPLRLAAAPAVEADEPGEVVDEQPRRTGWERTDLAAILDGTYEPPQPGILHRADGPGLFYPGLLHQVIGQPESGKSWLALLACAARLDAGERVLFLDYESDPAQVVARLLALGVERSALLALFDYRRPEVGVAQAAGTFAELLASEYALIILDGVTDAIGLHDAKLVDNDDTGGWIRQVPERLARETGAAVVMIDHTPKGNGGPQRYALGAQQKLGKIRGVSYYVEPRVPLAPGQVGELSVVGTKDTAGQVKRHGVPLDGEPRLWAAARIRIDATDPERLDVEIRPPFDVDTADARNEVGERGALYARDLVLMERVSRVLETAAEEMPTRAIVGSATGKRDRLVLALQALIREGFVAQRTVGVAQLHTSRRRFREDEDNGPPPPGATPARPGEPAPAAPEREVFEGFEDPVILTPGVDLQ